MKRKAIIIAVCVVVLAVVVYVTRGRSENGLQFKTEKVTKGDIEAVVTATGTVNPVTTVLVGTQVSGRIKNIYVDYNSPVKHGQLIALVDPAIFEAQFEQARANVLAAKANVKKAEAALLDSKRTLKRNRELSEAKVLSQSDLDTSETNYDAAEAQLSAAKAQVAVSQAAMKLSETNLIYTKIISPVDGIVISRNVDVGQTVAASFQTPTLFLIAQDLTKMQIDTSINEADVGRIKVGQSVDFTVDAYPDVTFEGKVSQVRNAPITVQNVVTYDVVVVVDNTDLRLKPGMTANVSIIVAERKGVIKVLNVALRFKPPEKGNGPRKGMRPMKSMDITEEKGYGIWILKDGSPRRVRVTTGISDGTYTELVSGDLNPGQEVIVETLAKGKEANKRPGPGFMR